MLSLSVFLAIIHMQTTLIILLKLNDSVNGTCIFCKFSLQALNVHLTVFVFLQLQLFAQLHSELELYYTQLLDDVVKTCLSAVKYPGAASSSNQVLLALTYCKHVKLCSVLDCYEIVLMFIGHVKGIIWLHNFKQSF